MQLYVLRHAKADEHSPTGRDDDRPLIERGREQCKFLCKLFKSGELAFPEIILCSPAARAVETARLLHDAAHGVVQVDPRLAPGARCKELCRIVEELAGRHRRAMMVGHNPGFEDLLAALGGNGHLQTGELVIIDMSLKTGHHYHEFGRFRLPTPHHNHH